ncbi:MAG: FAD-dependent monooxygenase [Burkholderiaceae bacterium]|nr:FAD-dependent monooxygenase [Burkholderiaceae bacterium]
MNPNILIAGGGIGGLAAALACARAGCRVQLFERASAFSEVGAGIQMGPNVVRLLHDWGLQVPLAGVAAFPQRLAVRDALKGSELGQLPLGERAQRLYGSPYATIARSDLHGLLLAAVEGRDGVQLFTDTRIDDYSAGDAGVSVTFGAGAQASGDGLIGADGLWSRVRERLLGDGTPRVSGHVAFRAMVPQGDLPPAQRNADVTVWLGPRLHVVQYPVRGGDWLNVVAIIEGRTAVDDQDWDQGATQSQLLASMPAACAPLTGLIESINHWRLWSLCDRPPMRGAWQQARGRVCLLGDAAHPMRPYLAQGAGMALEDAACLGALLSEAPADGDAVPAVLQRYAESRWQRCARVQARSIRNGEIFHASGAVRWGRDVAMRMLGERLLDVPWLYGGGIRQQS